MCETKKTIAVSEPIYSSIEEPPVLSSADDEHEIEAVLPLDAMRPVLRYLNQHNQPCGCHGCFIYRRLPQEWRDWAKGGS